MIIHVRNFGKIESADIDISNFSIFVGENNSGKTYLMQLIYGVLSCFYEEKFQKFLGQLDGIKIDIQKEFMEIKLNDKEILNYFQDKLNEYLNKNKKEILKKTFHTNNLTIESLSVEFGEALNSVMKIKNKSKDESKDEEYTTFYIIINRRTVKIHFSVSFPKDYMEQTIRRNILILILSEYAGILFGNTRKSENKSILYLPASRSGIMLLYANYLANDNTKEKENVIYEEDSEIENEYGLTEPIYQFLMFLLKHKDSEMLSESDREILSFINENIINGRFIKAGNTMRYKPDSSEQTIPIYLSSSLVSELAPICQILSGIQHYGYLLYDEIETCQHPTKQLQLARLLIRMVNSGYKMIVSTHSDTMAAAINNLITLSCKEDKTELAAKLGYTEDDLLQSENVHAYQFIIKDGKTKVEELPNHFSVGVGFDFTLFNKTNQKIYEDAYYLAEGEHYD